MSERNLYKKQNIPPKTAAPSPEERDKEILAGASKFFTDSIPAFDPEALESHKPRDLLETYDKMMDEEPTLDGFRRTMLRQLCDIPGKEEQCRGLEVMTPREVLTDERLSGLFKKFLIEKLPRDLLKERAERVSKERGYEVDDEDMVDEVSVNDLMAIHEKRPFRTVSGFHASKKDLPGGEIEQSRFPSTIMVGGEKIEVPAGYTHYNLNPEALYKGNLSAGGPNFLYLVEGSTAGKEDPTAAAHAKASGSKQWQVLPGKLRVRAKIELTPRVIEELGLKFE